MDRVKRWMGISGGRRPGEDQQPPDIQQPGGGHGKQQQQSQTSNAHSKFGRLSRFQRTFKRDSGTTTSHVQSPAQSNSISVTNDTLAPANGSITADVADEASDSPLDSAWSRPEGNTLSEAAHSPTGLGRGGDIVLDVHCSPPPQVTTSSGKPKYSATAIPVSNLQDSVTTTIAPNPSSQIPVSPPTSDLQTSSTVPQALGDTKCISGTKNGPVSPSISAHLWQKALEIAQESLVKHKLPSLEIDSFKSQSAAENIQSLLAELEAAKQENKNRQWRYLDRQGNEVAWVEHLGKILKSVDKYAKIVDIAIQHHPDVTSLVWAGARAILQVALHHVEAIEYFEGAMVTIMDKMAVSAFYAGIYTGVGLQTAMGDTGKLCKVLNMALPEFYAAVIVFVIKARQYFEARWLKKAVDMLKPFAIEFQPFIDDITGKEKTVQECADMATMERIRRSSEKMAEMENHLIDMRAEIKQLFRLNGQSVL
ncbi:hypothetical protein EV426DRAFT_188583 [Tirmania nivea]|nr:hypothetical protein EV426DRAFT_188583 [Tirmania nivea]